MKLYKNIADHINQRPYQLLVPASYMPQVNLEVFDQKRPQVIHLGDGTTMRPRYRRPTPHVMYAGEPDKVQHAAYPISHMIDMFNKEVPFQLAIEYEVVEVFECLDYYLIYVFDLVKEGNAQVIDYVRKTLAFREATYQHYYRYMYNNPEARDSLTKGPNKGRGLADRLRAANGPGAFESTDPLLARMKPPYVLPDDIAAGDKRAENLHTLMVNFSLEDTKTVNFDYESFMKG